MVAVAVAVVAIADDNDNDDDVNDGMLVFELVVMVLLYTVDVDDYWLAMSLAA